MLIKTVYAPSGFEEKMLRENRIANLLDYSRADTEEGLEYWFDISGRKSLKGFFAQEGINCFTITLFLQELNKACNNMEKFLLNTGGLILGIDTVFFKGNGGGFTGEFAYIPEWGGEFLAQLQKVFEYVIQNVDHSDVSAVRLCYRLFEMISRGDAMLEELLKVCHEMKEIPESPVEIISESQLQVPAQYRNREKPPENISSIEPFDEEEDGFYYDEDEIIEHPKQKLKDIFANWSSKINLKPAPKPDSREDSKRRPKSKRKDRHEDYSEMEDFFVEPKLPVSEYNGTTVLVQGKDGRASLIHEGPEHRESILIDKPHFNIGSRKTGNDAVISDDVISRCHAAIDREGDEYFLEDMESRNGTFVNGNIIGYRQRVRLKSGDLVAFANICYRFYA